MSAFGDTLKQIRKSKGLRQFDLANSLGLSQTTIANYEQGIRFPDEAVLNLLADHLQVSVDQLLGRPVTQTRANPAVRPRAIASHPDLNIAVEKLVAGQFDELQDWFGRKVASGIAVEDIYCAIIQPAMYEIGQLWSEGKIDVYQEHAITEQVKRLLAGIIGQPRPNADGPGFLGFAVSGDMHELGIRMVCDLLQLAGWKTLFLGVNLPPSSVLAAIKDFKPKLIGISATLEQHVPIVQNTIFYIRQHCQAECPPIVVGGFAFWSNPDLAKAVGADAVAVDGCQALDIAKSLIVS